MRLEPILILLGFCIVCQSSGFWLAVTLWPERWARQRWIVMPILGAAWLMLASGTLTYLGFALQPVAVPIALSGPILGGAVYWLTGHKHPPRTARRCLALLGAIGLAGALLALFPLIAFRAWNPYNDAVSYCAIADYLLRASYLTPADPGAFHPILSVMKAFQTLGWSGGRLGSSLLLAAFTGLYHQRFSCDLYPSFTALGIFLGPFGLWILCRDGLLMRRGTSLMASIFYALHLGIPIPIALDGFLAQTWAMVFVPPLLAVWLRGTSVESRHKRWVLTTLFLAVLLLTYPPIVPFIALGVATVFALRTCFHRLALRRALRAWLLPLVLLLLLVPGLVYRAAGEIVWLPRQGAGWDPRFKFMDYVLMTGGHQSIFGGLGSVSGLRYLPIKVAAILAGICIAYGAIRGARVTTRQIGGLALVFVAVFCCCLWFTPNPFRPGEVGSPYHAFKAFSFGFFLLPPLWALGVALCLGNHSALRWVAGGMAAVLALSVIPAAYRVSWVIAQEMRMFVGAVSNPAAEYQRLARVVEKLGPNTPINLFVPHEASEHKRVAAYYLRHPTISKWDDVYISPWLAKEYRNPAIDLRYPTLVYAPGRKDVVAANFTLRRGARFVWVFGEGWYLPETDGASSWNWLERLGNIDIISDEDVCLSVSAKLWVAGQDRTITLTVDGQADKGAVLRLPVGTHTLAGRPLRVPRGEHRLAVAVDGPPARFPADSRNLSLQVRDFELHELPQRGLSGMACHP